MPGLTLPKPMRRRNFIQTTGAVATTAAATAQTSESRKPNLVIIHCDELNFRTIGCYRDTLTPEQAFMWGKDSVCETPHIDSIAAEGRDLHQILRRDAGLLALAFLVHLRAVSTEHAGDE